MKPVVIKESSFKIFKKYFLLFLLGSPILIMVFGEPQTKIANKDENMQEVFLWLYVAYCSVLFILLLLRLIKSQYKSIIRLDEKGITMNEKDFFPWLEIYDFRIGMKVLKYEVLTSKGYPSGRKEFEERKILIINEQEFIIKEKFLEFKLEDIAEIIKIYKERLQTNQVGISSN